MDLQYGDQGGVHGTGVMYPQHPQNDRKRGREDIATPLEVGSASLQPLPYLAACAPTAAAQFTDPPPPHTPHPTPLRGV